MKKYLTALITGLISFFILGIIPAAASTAPLSVYDYGDAPVSYPTLFLNNGARHTLGSGLFLGQSVNGELNGQPSPLIDLYDDGIEFETLWVRGFTANIGVFSSGEGYLNAWVDFNSDGDWADAGEQIFDDEVLISGSNSLSFYIPDTAVLGFTFARFRLDSGGNLNVDGVAPDGEVEDYMREITSPVPVPASLVLLGIGLLGFAGLSRKKMTHLNMTSH